MDPFGLEGLSPIGVLWNYLTIPAGSDIEFHHVDYNQLTNVADSPDLQNILWLDQLGEANRGNQALVEEMTQRAVQMATEAGLGALAGYAATHGTIYAVERASGSGLLTGVWNGVCNLFRRNGNEIVEGIPEGINFQGVVHRAVNSQYVNGAWNLHVGNYSGNHRYSGVGRSALYTGTSEDAVFGEMAHAGTAPSAITMVRTDVDVENILDLTNPQVRESLGITLEDIVGDDYEITQALGDFARTRYNGLLVPSARAEGTTNLVLFNSPQ